MKEKNKVNRYTTLPVLLDMLTGKRLVLLDPSSWEDKNDSEIMLEYKKRRKVERLFACCLSMGDETIHHWRTFADGISGCCIEFDKERLIERIEEIVGIRYGPIKYRKIRDIKNREITTKEIPFTKRWPYRCEEEYRIIWEGKSSEEFFEIPIDLSIINKITLNQRMPKQVYRTIREHLRGVFKDPDKRISHSTLYQNDIWIAGFKR